MSRIKVEGLTKRFGSLVAVDQLNFEVKEGEVFGLLGPNGAGKTTTIRMLASLISPSSGSAQVGGYNILENSLKVREQIGILTENPSLYERLTAYENMDFFAEAYGLTELQEKKNRVRELLSFFGLWEWKNIRVARFSKGMKQKLAIARTIVHNPPFLFLDEPTSGLDPESSKAIRDMIKDFSEHERHTVLLCTHRLEDAERLCHRVMIINRGRQIIIGSPRELQDQIEPQPIIQITLQKIDQKILNAVQILNSIKDVKIDDSLKHTHVRMIITVGDVNNTPEIIKKIVYAGGMVLSVNVLRPTLEETYLKLVKEDRA